MSEASPNPEKIGGKPQEERRLKSRVEEFNAGLVGVNTLEDILFLAGKKLVGTDLKIVTHFLEILLNRKSDTEAQRNFLTTPGYEVNLRRLPGTLSEAIHNKLSTLVGLPQKNEDPHVFRDSDRPADLDR